MIEILAILNIFFRFDFMTNESKKAGMPRKTKERNNCMGIADRNLKIKVISHLQGNYIVP